MIGVAWIVREQWPKERVVETIVTLPAAPETVLVHMPAETAKVFIVERDTINTVVTRYVYDTVRVACQDLSPRRRLLSAVFAAKVGDTTKVLSELMSFSDDSLTFQQQTESVYTLGMPRRIGTDLEGATIEWIPFPTEKINSCSIWTRIAHLTVGAGGGILLGEVFR